MTSIDYRDAFSTENLDYLQRSGPRYRLETPPAGAPFTSAPLAALRHLVRVDGVGQIDKAWAPKERAAAPKQDESTRLPSEDLLIGLHGYAIPLAFALVGDAAGTKIEIGHWSPATESASHARLKARNSIISTVLDGAYPGVEHTPLETYEDSYEIGGLVMGMPTAKPPDPLDRALPVDRLIRAMAGRSWKALVLAQPVLEDDIRTTRIDAINEMRAVQAASQAAMAPSALAEHLSQILQILVISLTHGQAVGAWRTAVYLLGDRESYYQLCSAWRSTFAGERSLPEPVRIWQFGEVPRWAADWSMPDVSGDESPGKYRHLFKYQTLLTSSQLAAYVHLPQLETPGFKIKLVPEFDIVPSAVPVGSAIGIGAVLQRGRRTDSEYAIDAQALASHTFVTGVTGQGKTRTVFRLMRGAAQAGIKMLVIEPAKTEYRSLATDPMFSDLRIFTVGDEQAAPLRLNPFDFPPGVSVSVHLDLLRSVFTASFGMWTPLPQILEQCLHEVYVRRGWDIEQGTNRRSPGVPDPLSYPTLSDLVQVVPEITRRQGFDPEANDRILASLRTRLNALRTGPKGRMLDTQRSIPMEELLEENTLLELEAIGDDDDKAFIIGLLLIRLVEHRRSLAVTASGAEEAGTDHILIIEEAHRLLANVPRSGDEEQADPRGKAVETFSNLLAEIRAYGQGVVVVDQVPTKLAPDVIKNTNLKIAHRIVAGDDREALAKAMLMDDRQSAAMATLVKRQAVVFAEADDAPMLVEIHAESKLEAPEDSALRMSAIRERHPELFDPTPACHGLCSDEQKQGCGLVRAIVEDDAVQAAIARALLSAIEHPQAVTALWNDVVWLAQSQYPSQSEPLLLDHCLSVRAAAWFAQRRGAQAGWSYAETREVEDKTRALLLAKENSEAAQEYQRVMLERSQRAFAPYPRCEEICSHSAACLYRNACADLIDGGSFTQRWSDARAGDQASGDGDTTRAWQVAQNAAWRVIAFPDEIPEDLVGATAAAKRTALCFSQQMLAAESGGHPRDAEAVLDSLIREAQL